MFNARAHHRMHKQMTKKRTVPAEDLALYNVCVWVYKWDVYMSGYHGGNHSISILRDIPQCYWRNVVWIELLYPKFIYTRCYVWRKQLWIPTWKPHPISQACWEYNGDLFSCFQAWLVYKWTGGECPDVFCIILKFKIKFNKWSSKSFS